MSDSFEALARGHEGLFCIDNITGERPFYTMSENRAQRYWDWLLGGGWCPRFQRFHDGEWRDVETSQEPSEKPEPWGWKVTIHAYGTGPIPSSDGMIAAANRAAEMVEAQDFVGVDFKRIQNQPQDQGAS